MAVPKKRRIGYKLLNKGFDRKYWISLALNHFFVKLAVNSLKSLAPTNVTKFRAPLRAHLNLSAFWRCLTKRAALKKRAKLKRITHKGVLSPQLTLLPRKKPFKFKPWVGDSARPYPKPFLRRPLKGAFFFSPKANLYHVPFFTPKGVSSYPLSLVQHLLACRKQAYSLIRTPHYWGGQRSLLLSKWTEAPTYVYTFSPQARVLWLTAQFEGFSVLNTPVNLSWPKGPSLKDLYAYIKLNPNEGYWMYCLLLRIFKKWQRWVRFPNNYLIRRNLWKQQRLVIAYAQNLYYHTKAYPLPFRQIWATRSLPLNFKLAKSPVTCFSIGWLALTKGPRVPCQPKVSNFNFFSKLVHLYRNSHLSRPLTIKTFFNYFK